MNLKFFSTRKMALDVDVILLLIRLLCGYVFILAGMGKIQSPMGWMGPQSDVPGVLQALAAIAEFGGGIALVLGVLTRLASFGIGCTMIAAIIFHKFVMGDPFMNPTGGGSYQSAVSYLMFSVILMFLGAGRFSLDAMLLKGEA